MSSGNSSSIIICTQQICDDSQSIYGYRPSLAATLIFLIIFVLSGIVHQVQGIQTRTWFFSTACVLGSIGEALGYVAKILLWQDPFSNVGFKISIVMLTLAPAFYSAAIYYTLKHIALTFGPSFSRLTPKYYTWIFIAADLLAIVLQAVGGGIASGSEDEASLKLGDNIMIAGLVFQVFTLVAFGLLAADYAFAAYRNKHHLNPATMDLRRTLKFKLFLGALSVAYVCILIRCVYRVAELAGGWSETNEILRREDLFTGLDSFPVALATLVLNVWHPGWCFPKESLNDSIKLSSRGKHTKGADSDVSAHPMA